MRFPLASTAGMVRGALPSNVSTVAFDVLGGAPSLVSQADSPTRRRRLAPAGAGGAALAGSDASEAAPAPGCPERQRRVF